MEKISFFKKRLFLFYRSKVDEKERIQGGVNVVKKINVLALITLLLILFSQWFVFQQELRTIDMFHHAQKEQFHDMHRDPFPIEHQFKEQTNEIYKDYFFIFGFLLLSILFCITFLFKNSSQKNTFITRTVIGSCFGITAIFYLLDQLLTSIYL